MRIAIISDIHSNKFALEAVLNDIAKEKISNYIILGDIFGYYPWAWNIFQLIQGKNIIAAILGNHDELVLADEPNIYEHLEYYPLARHNRSELEKNEPDALKWLSGLKLNDSLNIENYRLTLCHGTPDNTLDGRYYPDDDTIYDWFPQRNEILLLGNTHYPLMRKTELGGIIFNPGSVGQPRDGITSASWGIWDTEINSWHLKRSGYDHEKAIDILTNMNWNRRAIVALSKTYTGKLIL